MNKEYSNAHICKSYIYRVIKIIRNRFEEAAKEYSVKPLWETKGKLSVGKSALEILRGNAIEANISLEEIGLCNET